MTDLAADVELGLRERKRLATRRAIQHAVLTLSLEHGYDHVTVDDISHAAQVSPRTFFNYFPSKEAAVVGDMPTLPGEDAVEAFVHAGAAHGVLDGIRDLLADAADDGSAAEERDVHALRRSLLKDNPQLFTLRMASMKQLEADLAEIVRRRLELDEPDLARDPAAIDSKARLITLVAFAGIRHAWWCWADLGGRGKLSAKVRDSFNQLQELGHSTL